MQSGTQHASITAFEMGLILASQTAGSLVAYRNTEPFVSKFGIKWSLHIGFTILVASSYLFWMAAFQDNDTNFATAAFLSRFAIGFGSGILNSVSLLVRVSGQQHTDAEPDAHFRWHLKGEGFGYLMGPVFVLVVYHSSAAGQIYFYLASITAVIWLLFTFFFSEETTNACDPTYYSTNSVR